VCLDGRSLARLAAPVRVTGQAAADPGEMLQQSGSTGNSHDLPVVAIAIHETVSRPPAVPAPQTNSRSSAEAARRAPALQLIH